jgi:predicted ribosome quality control (RQC) complex YloA/Tae2 family protein
MPFDSIAISCLSRQLSDAILGSKIEKVYQPEKDEIHLLLRKPGFSGRLLISADTSNPRVHLTSSAKENPITAPMFCMLMRKHLTGGKIKSISQHGFERVLDIEVQSYSELGDLDSKHIIVEIMGKHSNIIFTDGDMRIIDSIKHIDITVSSVRNVLPGISYSPPPSQHKQNPLITSKKEIEQILKNSLQGFDITISRAILSCFMGISPLAARELAYRAAGDEDTLLLSDNIPLVSDALSAFINDIKSEVFSPCVIVEKGSGKPIDFAAFNVSLYNNLTNVVCYANISEALDDFFTTRDKMERMRQKGASLRKIASNAFDRLRKKMTIQENIIKDAENKEQLKIYGELITSNLYRINGKDKFASVENYYEADSPVIEIPLDNTKSPSQNAQNYFKRYRKIKTAEAVAIRQRKTTITEIEYIESVIHAIDTAESIAELDQIRNELSEGGYIHSKKKDKKTKSNKPSAAAPRSYILPGGFELLVGKNNKQNDYLSQKLAKNQDLWFHVKNSPGSHVVLRFGEKPFPNTVIEYAAGAAAYFSSVNKGTLVEVDYTEIRNVKKPPGGKPGMVIYDKYSTAYVKPLSPEDITENKLQ